MGSSGTHLLRHQDERSLVRRSDGPAPDANAIRRVAHFFERPGPIDVIEERWRIQNNDGKATDPRAGERFKIDLAAAAFSRTQSCWPPGQWTLGQWLEVRVLAMLP